VRCCTDSAVTPPVEDLDQQSDDDWTAWRKLIESALPALNQQLKPAGFPEIKNGRLSKTRTAGGTSAVVADDAYNYPCYGWLALSTANDAS